MHRLNEVLGLTLVCMRAFVPFGADLSSMTFQTGALPSPVMAADQPLGSPPGLASSKSARKDLPAPAARAAARGRQRRKAARGMAGAPWAAPLILWAIVRAWDGPRLHWASVK